MNNAPFATFFKIRSDAAQSYANGDVMPLERMLPADGQSSFHSPGGDTVTEAGAVAQRYRQDAAAFEPGGDSKLEVLQMGDSGDLAFWAGYQVATVRAKGATEPVQIRIRVTEVFRREEGGWKLVHRHADMARKS